MTDPGQRADSVKMLVEVTEENFKIKLKFYQINDIVQSSSRWQCSGSAAIHTFKKVASNYM